MPDIGTADVKASGLRPSGFTSQQCQYLAHSLCCHAITNTYCICFLSEIRADFLRIVQSYPAIATLLYCKSTSIMQELQVSCRYTEPFTRVCARCVHAWCIQYADLLLVSVPDPNPPSMQGSHWKRSALGLVWVWGRD